MSEQVLEVRDLHVHFETPEGIARAVEGASFAVGQGETLGLVGESGCGKSVTALATLGLLDGNCRIEGEILFEGRDLLRLPESQMRRIRGNRISMIFQEPMTSLNPVFTAGEQVAEVFRIHKQASRGESRDRAVEMLRRVHLPEPERRARQYPHQLSGGQRQRVMIAMALACSPSLLIADEPTTALDVTIQAQILELLLELQQEEHMSVLLITHDLGVVAQAAHRVAVMYAGRVVESCRVGELFAQPRHPYTRGLLESIPRMHQDATFRPIPGRVPRATELPDHCPFHERCDYRVDRCHLEDPGSRQVAEQHWVRCWVDLEPEDRIR